MELLRLCFVVHLLLHTLFVVSEPVRSDQPIGRLEPENILRILFIQLTDEVVILDTSVGIDQGVQLLLPERYEFSSIVELILAEVKPDLCDQQIADIDLLI